MPSKPQNAIFLNSKETILVIILLAFGGILLKWQHELPLSFLYHLGLNLHTPAIHYENSHSTTADSTHPENLYFNLEKDIILLKFQYEEKKNQLNHSLKPFVEHTLLDTKLNKDYIIPVQVLTRDIYGKNHYYIINKGSSDNIQTNMAFITISGLAGIVVKTTSNRSLVLSHQNPNFHLSAMITSSNISGIVEADLTHWNQLQLRYVTSAMKINPGDMVYTSGYSNTIPPYLLIGKVKTIDTTNNVTTPYITIEPASKVTNINYGFVITYPYDNEIDSLSRAYQNLSSRINK